MSHERVVITGMGVITTIGQTLPDYFESLMAGRSGIGRWKSKDPRLDSKIGGDLSDFDFAAHMATYGADYPPALVAAARKLLRGTPLVSHLTIAAALQAFCDAGLHTGAVDLTRVGHLLAGHNLSNDYLLHNAQTLAEAPEFIEPFAGLYGLDTDPLSVTSELLGLKGPSFTIGAACASSNMALLTALDLLRLGRADLMMVSGVSAELDAVTLQSWAIMDALSISSFNDEPARASRPFDAQREGFVPSHAAGVLVLERASSATARGARVYAEVLGAAAASNASRSPKSDLDGQLRSMRQALQDAGVAPDEVDYINAHATSTPTGDPVEVAAIKQLFGDHAYRIPINATKSMIGHCLTAAGVVELIATVLQMVHGRVHPTINLDAPDPDLDLDFVPNQARAHPIRVALSNAFGFGGLNASLVVGNYDAP